MSNFSELTIVGAAAVFTAGADKATPARVSRKQQPQRFWIEISVRQLGEKTK